MNNCFKKTKDNSQKTRPARITHRNPKFDTLQPGLSCFYNVNFIVLPCCFVSFFLVQVFTYFFTDWFLLFWKKIHERVWPCVATFSENWFWSESQPQLRGPRNHVAIDVLLPSHDYTDFAHANVLASNKLLHWSFTLSRCACLRWLECSTSSPIPRGKKCKVKKNMLT